MEIHKPKPWHSLREFLKEYAIIVMGVLTALAGEQTVEWAHWRHEVRETEEALRHEIGHNIGALEYRVSQNDCVDQRMDELERWRHGWAAGGKPQLTGPIGSVVAFTLFTDGWEVAESGQVAAHIPLERRMEYAKLYASIRSIKAKNDQESANWRSIQDFDGNPTLDAQSMMKLRGMINYFKYYDFSVAAGNLPSLKKRAAALGIASEPVDKAATAALDESRAALCKSIFPKA
jgi:hypothetical protein